MPEDYDYEDRSASDRSTAGYVVLAIVGLGITALIIYDLRSSGPADTSLPQQGAAAPQQASPASQMAPATPALNQP
ncbi:hypothetical protein [Aurantimonas endophytica]|uniref:Uncharacterized protein n=1 Tax=Aurantimonas endophytica TaxID=1522175 RepID=A0A7W6MQF5_9HYPH|nr:hypothetical protein [Aurantimonas endophytica]MBB4003918.1 hypothetical protein [Aurantimonas endophytica]MCO6404769.1 hypothetical protein [Aurantimonas endophytica]